MVILKAKFSSIYQHTKNTSEHNFNENHQRITIFLNIILTAIVNVTVLLKMLTATISIRVIKHLCDGINAVFHVFSTWVFHGAVP